MKITINLKNEAPHSSEVPFFRTKSKYLKCNWGMQVYIHATVVSIDDEYIKNLGITTEVSEFIMDCIKEDLRVVSINGKPLVNEKNEEFYLNPYSEEYLLNVNNGHNSFEIELAKYSDIASVKKTNRKLLIKS